MEKRDHYLYWHRRLDTNEIFYVGIGTVTKGKENSTFKAKYSRAHDQTQHGNWWKNIKNKAGYKVEIIFESTDYILIKQQEISLIALFGRKDIGLGGLCNLDNGGDGSCGVIRGSDFRRRVSETHKKNGRNKGVNSALAKKVIDTKTKEVYGCLKDAARANNLHHLTFRSMILGIVRNKTSCIYLDNYVEGMVIEPDYSSPQEKRKIKIINLETNKVFCSFAECMKHENLKYSKLKRFLRLKQKFDYYEDYLKNNGF